VRPLAVSSTRRSPFLPDVPTLQEATGLPIPGADAWNGFCAPAGTPAPVINKLYREIVAIIRTPEITKRLGALTNEVVGSSPEEFSAFMRAERAKWFKYAKILNVVPQ
jgi:tripartite-type tricarboxylate transporter receptor subunit TctC